jgi:hypothetical protein
MPGNRGAGSQKLPVVALDHDGQVGLGLAQGKHVRDAGTAAGNGQVEQGNGVCQAIGCQFGAGATAEQEVLPVFNAIVASGKAVTGQGLDVVLRW